MIGVVVGLVTTLAITQILLTSEGNKRTTASGSDAQVNGVLAVDTLQDSIQAAGYGFTSLPQVIGCPLIANYNGAAVAGFPANLVPVIITDGASGAPDSIRIISSSKQSFSVPINIVDPSFHVNDLSFPVNAVNGVALGDLMVAAKDSATNCEVFQATATPITSPIARADNAWNSAGFPDIPYPTNSFVINLGALSDITYSVSAAGSLQSNKLVLSNTYVPSYTGNTDVYTNIVNMQAYYGKATSAGQPITVWDNVTPTTNADWLLLLALQVAVVSRSDQYEKEIVTTGDLYWDVGANSTIAGTVTCPTSTNKCVKLIIPKTANSDTWKHYRYKVFNTVIPLRNMIWNS
jgi:type IV pilus assembly protein PilW